MGHTFKHSVAKRLSTSPFPNGLSHRFIIVSSFSFGIFEPILYE